MQKTIKKVLDELAKDKPDLSYIRGMLEVLIDSEEDTIKVTPNATLKKGGTFPIADHNGNVRITSNKEMIDEGAILDAKAKESIATIKALANESVTE